MNQVKSSSKENYLFLAEDYVYDFAVSEYTFNKRLILLFSIKKTINNNNLKLIDHPDAELPHMATKI